MNNKLYSLGYIGYGYDLIESLKISNFDFDFISLKATPRRIFDVILSTKDLDTEEEYFYRTLEIPIIISKNYDEINKELNNLLKNIKPISNKLIKYRYIIDKHQFINEKIEQIELSKTGHNMRVAMYSKKVANALHLSNKACLDIYVASLMYDIGKIYVPKQILSKKSKLNKEELEELRRHSEYGYELLKFDLPNSIADILKYHYTYDDGTIYLESNVDNIGMKIIAVTDSFDSLTTNKVRFKQMTKKQAIKELKLSTKEPILGGKGTLLDPYIIETLSKTIN